MKTKSSSKATSKKSASAPEAPPKRKPSPLPLGNCDNPAPLAPAVETTGNPPSTLSPAGECSVQAQIKKVRDFMEPSLPNLKDASDADVIAFCHRFTPIFRLIYGETVAPWLPPWVLVAWRKALAGIRIDFDKLKSGDKRELGKLVGLMESIPLPDAVTKYVSMESAFSPVDSWIMNTPRAEASPFHAGWKEGATTIKEKVEQPEQRKAAIAAIALFWLEVQKKESAGQLHRWLVDWRILAKGTDPAETRKICRSIGLSFRKGSEGRPNGKSGLHKDD